MGCGGEGVVCVALAQKSWLRRSHSVVVDILERNAVALAELSLDPPASASKALGSKVCSVTAGPWCSTGVLFASLCSPGCPRTQEDPPFSVFRVPGLRTVPPLWATADSVEHGFFSYFHLLSSQLNFLLR